MRFNMRKALSGGLKLRTLLRTFSMVVGLVALVFANFAGAVDALPESGDPNDLIMDDGTRHPAPYSARQARNDHSSFEPGDPGPLGYGELDDAHDAGAGQGSVTVRSRSVTTQFLPEADGLMGDVIQASESGGVVAAGDYPTRTIVRIRMRNAQGQEGICTGWLLTNDKVVTAAHCMHEGQGGDWFPRSSYRVAPDATSSTAPYGTCGVAVRSTTNAWMSVGHPDPYRFDLGAMLLDCTFSVGYMGFFTVSDPIEEDSRAIEGVLVGYTGRTSRVRTNGKITASLAGRAFYTNKSTGGFSGAPRWNFDNPNCDPCVHALHRDNGEGLAVDSVRFETLRFWRFDW